jgi:hypothetical protein
MSADAKKVAAAMAAVGLYLQQEEAAREQEVAPQIKAQFSPWAHSGRQDMMNMRRLLQMRTFTR